MQFCGGYNIPMVDVISLSKEKHERFYKCPKCYSEARHKTIKNNELNFGEVLDKEIHKGRYNIHLAS